ncbi:MAG: ZIP family metal transporter [Tissierellia bacterium]|nr:ZIP family metal transporter [Tissierellia bacterium]
MNVKAIQELILPFVGTTAGSAMVFLMKGELNDKLRRGLTGFAGGVMMAASIWSLILPSLSMSGEMGRWSFFPAVLGFWLGTFFLLLLDHIIPHQHMETEVVEGPKVGLGKSTMLVLAVALHNIPEGLAVGVSIAAWLYGETGVAAGASFALALGIAIQNFPEGAIISMPLHGEGMKKEKAFLYGTLSGAVEPLSSILTILFATRIVPLMPYLLSFAAGAMVYVVVEELIPEMNSGEHSNIGVLTFGLGFTLMIILDIALG